MSFTGRDARRSGGIIVLLATVLAAMGGGAAPAFGQSFPERIEFSGFLPGEVIRDQYAFRGLRMPADPGGGPYYDDADVFAAFLDSAPGLLSLSPFAGTGGPGAVHGSVGTYIFDFVDPGNPFVSAETDSVTVAMAFPDRGDTVLEAWDADGNKLGEAKITLTSSSFYPITLQFNSPGIRRATVTTPLWSGSIGALVDTLTFNRPPGVPARDVTIDIRPGSPRNTIRLGSRTTVRVALLSSPTFDPERIDLAKILFQGAGAVTAMLVDKNRDRRRDWILTFDVADLQGLTATSTEGILTAVDTDGTPLRGVDSIIVQTGALAPIAPLPGGDNGGASLTSAAPR